MAETSSFKCHFNGCPGTPTWQPAFELQHRKDYKPYIAHLYQIVICEGHKEMSKLADFLSDEGWNKIIRHIKEAGKKPPQRALTNLIFEPLTSTLPF